VLIWGTQTPLFEIHKKTLEHVPKTKKKLVEQKTIANKWMKCQNWV
jgi:hypothetical protein